MRTRLTHASIAIGVLLVVGVTGAIPNAGAQVEQNQLTVVKVVEGPVPSTASFTVQVDCQPVQGGAVPTVTFDASGTATSNPTFPVGAGPTCVVSETQRGGARNVNYACATTPGPTDPDGTLASCTDADGNTVHFGDVVNDSATITVTNSFGGPPAVPPPVAEAVQVAPVFTG
jgi:hypothetical protein